jgi:hypothetical protein
MARAAQLKRWLYRLLRMQPRYRGAIIDGERVDFDKPLTTWQAIAEVQRKPPTST